MRREPSLLAVTVVAMVVMAATVAFVAIRATHPRELLVDPVIDPCVLGAPLCRVWA